MLWIHSPLLDSKFQSPIICSGYSTPGDVNTAQKMKFSIKNFFTNCDQIRRKLRIWSYLVKKSLMENFIFCAVSENTEVSQKEIDNCHSARRLSRIGKPANQKCCTKWSFWKIRENFQENIRGSILFLILLTKILHHGCFLWNFLKYFRTPQYGCFWNYPGK